MVLHRRPLTSTERSRRFRARMTAAQRTARKAHYARKRRVDLVRLLSPSGRCACCGSKVGHARLFIDHTNGRLWIVSKLSPAMRAARYWSEFRAGVPLRAVCEPCSDAGGGRRYTPAERSRRASRAV